MSSCIARIEIYEDEEQYYSYGCPDLDLMGYSSVTELIEDIAEKLKEKKKND